MTDGTEALARMIEAAHLSVEASKRGDDFESRTILFHAFKEAMKTVAAMESELIELRCAQQERRPCAAVLH